MLSDVGIRQYIDRGDIILQPFDDSMIEAARVTLHLHERILIPVGNMVVDLQEETVPEYKEIIMTNESPFALTSGAFILGSTYEHVGLSQNVGMLIDGRSTLGRLGISVTQTSMIVDSGEVSKPLTLNIKNSGPHTVLLYPRLRFARACFFLLDQPASQRYDDKGRYNANDDQRPILRNDISDYL